MKLNYHLAALISMAVAILAGAFASTVPETFPYVWVAKFLNVGFGASGMAALFLKPPGDTV